MRPTTLLAAAIALIAVPSAAEAADVDLGDGLFVRVTVPDEGTGEHPSAAVYRGGWGLGLEPKLWIDDIVLDVRVKASPDKRGVDVTYMLNCGGTVRVHYSRDALFARIEALEGSRLIEAGHGEQPNVRGPIGPAPDRHERTALDEGLAKLARATALDPDAAGYRLAAIRVLVSAKRLDEAIAIAAATPLRAQVMVTLGLRKAPELRAIAGAPVVAAWRHPGVGTAAVFPAYDRDRQLVAVSAEHGNAMSEAPGYSSAVLLDARSGEVLADLEQGDLPMLAELGFDAPFETTAFAESDGEGAAKPAFGVADLERLCRSRTGRIPPETRLVSGKQSACDWEFRLASWFSNAVLVTSHYDLGDGCGANNGSVFEVLRFEPSTTVRALAKWRPTVTANEARRLVRRHQLDAARALLAAVPAKASTPEIAAWTALASALEAGPEATATALAALPFPWSYLAATDPDMPPSVRAAVALTPLASATPGTASALPAFDPVRRIVAVADPAIPGATLFVAGDERNRRPLATTLVRTFAVTPAFLRDTGWMAPLAELKVQAASEGEWRAASADTTLRVVCTSDHDLVWSLAGKGIAHAPGACDSTRPTHVLLFDGAVAVLTETAPTSYVHDPGPPTQSVQVLFAPVARL